MTERILIYDIESKTFGGKPDPEKDIVRLFSAYSYVTGKHYAVTNVDDMRKMLTAHDVVVGFNTLRYDNRVLQRCGLGDIFKEYPSGDVRLNGAVNIDCMQVTKARAGSVKTSKGLLASILLSFSLDNVTRTLGLVSDDGKLQDFDYSLLQLDVWTEEQRRTIIEYAERDVDVTRKLYEFFEDYFAGFKDYMNDRDVQMKKYITCTTSAFAYKAMCKEMGWEEKYDDTAIGERYKGAYVAYPAGEHFSGNCYAFDFTSLYPHVLIQCNLFSHAIHGWHGGKLFSPQGTYNDVSLGGVETVLAKWFKQRAEYKRAKDPREYTVKIALNSFYGAGGSPKFSHIYNRTTASDCTSLSQQWIKFVREKLREKGYLLIYSDTDSVYVQDPFNDKQALVDAVDDVVVQIKTSVPFPQETFTMALEAEIAHIWFFKGKGSANDDGGSMDVDDYKNKPKGYLRKNYIYLTTDGKLVVKNLGVMKKSTSAVTRKLFWEHIVPRIKEEKTVMFPKHWFETLLHDLLAQDMKLAMLRYSVSPVSTYKSASSLHAQIAERYGAGIHFLIPNARVGVGKGRRYCTLDEFKEANLTIRDIDMTSIWQELSYFTKVRKMVDLTVFGGG